MQSHEADLLKALGDFVNDQAANLNTAERLKLMLDAINMERASVEETARAKPISTVMRAFADGYAGMARLVIHTLQTFFAAELASLADNSEKEQLQ